MMILGGFGRFLALLNCCCFLFLFDFEFVELAEHINWLTGSFYCATILTNIDANLIIVTEYISNDLISSD